MQNESRATECAEAPTAEQDTPPSASYITGASTVTQMSDGSVSAHALPVVTQGTTDPREPSFQQSPSHSYDTQSERLGKYDTRQQFHRQNFAQQKEGMTNRELHDAAVQRKASSDTRFFWDLVSGRIRPSSQSYGGFKRQNHHSIGSYGRESASEERFLFGKNVQHAEDPMEGACDGGGVILDDSIPVERSGARSAEVDPMQDFTELQERVPWYVMRNIQLMKYAKPTPIQKHAVPLGLAGIDLMCCAQTGSGKTFSFLLPVVAALSITTNLRSSEAGQQVGQGQPLARQRPVTIDAVKGCMPLAVVLAPTRELASQIFLDARRLMYGSGLKSVCIYGGSDMRAQLQELSTGCELIVATPGRLNDLIERGVVSLRQVSFLVLDEADRMLDMGFEPQIRGIVQGSDMPHQSDGRITFMFSATFPAEIQSLASEFLNNYVWVAVGRVGSTVENITQQVLLASSDQYQKLGLLNDVIAQTDGRTIIFVQKRRTASWLCSHIRSTLRIRVEEIHGDRSQTQREHALRQFRDGTIRILVATDVAARGLDVPSITHVIQFDMPLSQDDFDVYVHRIGRTGRAGQTGLATCFFVPGREVGEGNGKIAPQLLHLLQENNQIVPDWFLALDDLRTGRGGGGNRNYQQRGNYYRKQHYGSRDSHYAAMNRFGYGGGYQRQQQVQYSFGGRDVRGYQQPFQQQRLDNSRGGYLRTIEGGYEPHGQFSAGGNLSDHRGAVPTAGIAEQSYFGPTGGAAGFSGYNPSLLQPTQYGGRQNYAGNHQMMMQQQYQQAPHSYGTQQSSYAVGMNPGAPPYVGVPPQVPYEQINDINCYEQVENYVQATGASYMSGSVAMGDSTAHIYDQSPSQHSAYMYAGGGSGRPVQIADYSNIPYAQQTFTNDGLPQNMVEDISMMNFQSRPEDSFTPNQEHEG